jgi:hypothetical protein
MSDSGDPDPDSRPVRLDYFAINAPPDPIDTRSRRLAIIWVFLGLGWLPFACGVITSQATIKSGLPDEVRIHLTAGAAFMAMGLVISLACAVSFARASDRAATIVSIGCLFLQLCLFFCVGGS